MSFAPFTEGRHTTRSLAGFVASSRAFDVLEPRRADHGAGLAGAPRPLGCRRAALGADGCGARCAWPTASSAIPKALPALEITVAGPTLVARCDLQAVAVAGAPVELSVDGAAAALHTALDPAGRTDAAHRPRCRGLPRLPRGERRLRRAVVSGQRVDVHARPVRRAWRAGAACGRRAACRRAFDAAADAARRSRRAAAGLRRALADRRARRPARRARLLHPRRHRRLLRHRLAGSTTTPAAPACAWVGPKPTWARRDGGEAGLHPSNIHDNRLCDRRRSTSPATCP